MSKIEESLSVLNDKQKEAVDATEERILVIAGAGSGKTSVLTTKIAKLIRLDNVNPASIMAVTFTNKAAGEIKERIEKIVNDDDYKHISLNSLTTGTFHSIFNSLILRKNCDFAGRQEGYVIYDQDESISLLKKVINGLNIYLPTDKEATKKTTKLASACSNYIGYCKDRGMNFDDISTLKYLVSGYRLDYDLSDYEINSIHKIFETYENDLKKSNAFDFGDLLVWPYKYLTDPAHKNVLEAYQRRFVHILVDEFQDTNQVQYDLVILLSEKNNLFVVGDDDQSIYGWRGAEISNILNFIENFKDFKTTKEVKLEQNYRSCANILETANYVIKNNVERLGKTLWTQKEEGSKIILAEFNDLRQEIQYVTNRICSLVDDGVPEEDIAILYRVNRLSKDYSKELFAKGRKVNVVNGLDFTKRKSIKIALSYLKAIHNGRDLISLGQIVNIPPRGIGDVSKNKLLDFIETERDFKDLSMEDFDLIEALENAISEKVLSGKAEKGLINFTNTLKSIDSEALMNNDKIEEINDLTFSNLFSILLEYEEGEYTSIIKHLREMEDEDEENALESYIDVLVKRLALYDKEEKPLEKFLEEILLESSSEDRQGKMNKKGVKLMTVHTSKGLEFPYVFVVDISSDNFPNDKSLDLEEDRRLFYVALTRAKVELILSYAKSGIYGYNSDGISKKSLFLKELPASLVDEFVSNKFGSMNYPQKAKPNNFNAKKDNILKLGEYYTHKKFGTGLILKIEKKSFGFEVTGDFSGSEKSWIIPMK